MDDKPNYTLVGSFVLVLSGLLVAGVLWLAAGLGGRQAMDRYQAVIQESVSGLDVDAPVKYLGVDVGKVAAIAIDTQNSQQVRLQFLIVRGTPIKRDSQAVLRTQGLTGIAYVELSGGTAGSPALLPDADGVAPMIPFRLSLGARLEGVLGTALNSVEAVTTKLNAVLDADNQAALKSTLADLARLAHALAAQQTTIEHGLRDAARTAALGARAGEQISPVLARIDRSAAAVERMADVARGAGASAGTAADAATRTVEQVGSETLPELARLMAELNQLAAVLQQLSEQTRRSPNSLIVGPPRPLPGPGEAGERPP